MSNTSPNLKELLAGAQLPALPQSAIRLLELSQDPDNGPAEFATPIEADPGLAGQVLRFVNSSYFGFPREISSVKLAITLVGVRTIKNFALWSAVFSLMPNPKCGPLDLKRLWQDSLYRALFARTMGKSLGLKDAEDLFAAALLQDMAVPLLAKELPEEYEELLLARDDGRVRLSRSERERFGWSHDQAAAIIASSWSLPEEFIRLIEGHTELQAALSKDDPDLGQLAVCMSALLPAGADSAWHELPVLRDAFERVRDSDTPEIAEILKRVDADFDEFAPILKLSNPGKSLVERFEEAEAVQA